MQVIYFLFTRLEERDHFDYYCPQKESKIKKMGVIVEEEVAQHVYFTIFSFLLSKIIYVIWFTSFLSRVGSLQPLQFFPYHQTRLKRRHLLKRQRNPGFENAFHDLPLNMARLKWYSTEFHPLINKLQSWKKKVVLCRLWEPIHHELLHPNLFLLSKPKPDQLRIRREN